MSENPYQSPKAEAEPARRERRLIPRWIKAQWLEAPLLAVVSYPIAFAFVPLVTRLIVAPLIVVTGPPTSILQVALHITAGLLMHTAFWAVVLGIWRSRGASA